MSEAAEALRLEQRLRGVREAEMRRVVVLEALEARLPAEGYALAAAALHRRAHDASPLPLLRRSLEEALRDAGGRRLDSALRDALAAEAGARGDALLLRLLRPDRPARAMSDPGAALPPAAAELPLGVRRALARGIHFAWLERLLLDPDPVVILHVLRNPRITEDHVVRIAARRPIPASTLAEIERSARFGPRPRVRLALARNPYSPIDVAARAASGLAARELREIAEDPTLHEAVRRHARAELVRRALAAEE